MKITIIIVLFNLAGCLLAQEIKVTDYYQIAADISAREYEIKDANGDACSIIKVRTGLENLTFSTDLEIRKAESREGEYWLWVSPNTTKLIIKAEGIGDLEYSLPKYTEEYNVYVLILMAILPDKIIYRKINNIRIETKPAKTEVYIDNGFLGYSPLVINTTSDTIHYVISKKRHLSQAGTFVTGESGQILDLKLKKDPQRNRFYLMTNLAGGNKFCSLLAGVEMGMIGTTGWYISFSPQLRTPEWICKTSDNVFLEVYQDYFISQVGDSPNNYYIRAKPENNRFYTNFRLKFGVTRKIIQNTYLKIGVGYAQATQWIRLDVIPYSHDPLNEKPLSGLFYGKENFFSEGLPIETGLIYKLRDKFIFNFNISTTGLSFYSTGKSTDFFLPLEGSIGLGYNFR